MPKAQKISGKTGASGEN